MNKTDLQLLQQLYNRQHTSKKDLTRLKQLLFILNGSYRDRLKEENLKEEDL